MPYIKRDRRNQYDKILDQISTIYTKGDLEYCIFKLMKIYMKDREYKYSNLHDAVYAAMHCADEFRRRYLDVRENEALEKNGDIKVKEEIVIKYAYQLKGGEKVRVIDTIGGRNYEGKIGRFIRINDIVAVDFGERIDEGCWDLFNILPNPTGRLCFLQDRFEVIEE